MEISFSSVFSAVLSISLLTVLLFLILRRKKAVTHLGLGCMYIFLILILLRGLLPLDFSLIGFTTTVTSEELLPGVRDWFLTDLFSINRFAVTPFNLMLALWGIGSMFSAYRILKGYWIAAKIAKFSPKITDSYTLKLLQCAMDTLWTKSHPNFQLVENNYFHSPALWSLGKPILILPHLNYSEEELYLILHHELLHYKHNDYLFKLLIDLLRIVYWWNPLISMLFSTLSSQIQELWVDYQISNTKDQRIRYMQVLTTTLRHDQERSNLHNTDTSIILLTDAHKSTFIRQRFDYIKTNKIKSFTIYGIVLCFALFFSTYTIVFEPYYHPITDESGRPVYQDLEGETYFIRNGDKYDLYMENEFVGTLDKIPETFEDYPIYDSKEEVPQNEK